MTSDFAGWCRTASVRERCEALELLADALFDGYADPNETRHCEAALFVLVSDPSPKVRIALSERLASERMAPRGLIRLLCDDIDPVAVPLARHARSLIEDDLIDLATTGSVRLRCAVARRATVTSAVAAALVAMGERVVSIELLSNPGAEIAPSTIRVLATADGADGTLRDLLLQRQDLPADIRQTLLLQTGESLAGMDLARQVLGETAVRRIAAEACEHGTSLIAEDLDLPRMEAFVRHLRGSGQITTALLVRAACGGHVDLFAASLASLSGLSFRRVRAILVDARDPAFSALCAAARLPADVAPLLLSAVRIWRDVAREGHSGEGGASALVIERLAEGLRLGGRGPADELRVLLARLSAQSSKRAACPREPGRLAA